MLPYPRRCLAEFLGTFILLFAGTGAAIVGELRPGVLNQLAMGLVWGFVVMSLVYALGQSSGAHLNPAVTLGFAAARRFPLAELPGYVASQFAGALAASAVLKAIFPASLTLGATLPSGPALQSVVLELFLTAILMFIALCVATGAKEIGVMAGIAVGGVVAFEATFAGPVCGASMNPARSAGPALVAALAGTTGPLHALPIYLVAPILGALLGTLGWLAVRPPAPVPIPKETP
jgi:aquaporin Z